MAAGTRRREVMVILTDPKVRGGEWYEVKIKPNQRMIIVLLSLILLMLQILMMVLVLLIVLRL